MTIAKKSNKQSTQIIIGKILKPHGVRGHVKMECYMDSRDCVPSYLIVKDQLYNVDSASNINCGFSIVKLHNICDRNKASALAQQNAYIESQDLPKLDTMQCYQKDLINVRIIDENHQDIGVVIAMHNFGIGPMIEGQLNQGRTIMFSLDEEYVTDIMPHKHVIVTDIVLNM